MTQIYGGVDLTSHQLMRLCHTQTQPQVYLSTGNSIVVQFVSDISNAGRGFNATYHTVDGGKMTKITESPHESLGLGLWSWRPEVPVQ